ncbi:hypothetical protein ACFZBP_26700 [Streptomyces sp. NPDC008086]|uniref:hypothetical protein n=1 Tax=Streptomyces sp. NPDC008086 TaxID=3364807 RepID=UPI0036F0ED69
MNRRRLFIFPPRGEGDGYLAVCPLAGTEDFQVVARFPEGAPVDVSLEGVRLFDAFRGPHWTVVAVGVEGPQVPDAVRGVRGRVQASYGSGLFLVRPDGCVGGAGDRAAGLVDHLGRFGVR